MMELSDAELDALWNQLWELENRVNPSEPLALTDKERDLLRRAAPTVALTSAEAEATFVAPEKATALLLEIRKRIRLGSDRIGDALLAMYELQDAGDLDGARKQLEDVLKVEVVPSYREKAQKMLTELSRVAAVAESGRVDEALDDWVQLPIILKRLQQGHGLELNDGMRTFLHRVASSVAMNDAEAQEASEDPLRAGDLLRKIAKRIQQGSDRLQSAVIRMTRLRDAGDLEGARQPLRNVLAVEVIPKFRREAEELLASLDSPPGR